MSQPEWVGIGNIIDVSAPVVGRPATQGICELILVNLHRHFGDTKEGYYDEFNRGVGSDDSVCEAVYRCLEHCQYRWLAPANSGYAIAANREQSGIPKHMFIDAHIAGAAAYRETCSTDPADYPMWYKRSEYGQMRHEAWQLIHLMRFHFQANIRTGEISYDPNNSYGVRGEEVE